MSALTRKLGRDLWRTRAQVLSIAAVMAGGVMSVVALRGTGSALDRARREYYVDQHFADVFATLTRAPDAMTARLAAIPGVRTVTTRVVKDVRLDIPGLELPAVGRMMALPAPGTDVAGTLNTVRVMKGRAVAPGADDEILVSGRFAEANGLHPGDPLVAVINERRTLLHIVGIGASPDYLYEEAGGGMFVDVRSFGVLWAPHDLTADATGMRGAFNDVAIGLAAGARQAEVIAAVDSMLARYGGRGAIGRADQLSNRVVDNELRQLAVMALAFPVVFVAVAAFLVGAVLSRLVVTEREQIAILKAFGYTNRTVALHYLAYAAVAIALGIVLGIGVGIWFGRFYTSLYVEILRIPGLSFRADWATVGIAVGVIFVAALSGALGAVRRVAVMPPAAALQPPAPARYRRLLLDRLGIGDRLGAAPRMILRGLERRPSRALLGAAGVASALAMMAGALSLYDASRRMIDVQFRVGHRETLGLQFVTPSPRSIRQTFASLPGVTDVELMRMLPVRLRHDARSRTVALTGLEPRGRLHRLVDVHGQTLPLPPDGLVLSANLARTLDVRAGDTVEVELLETGKKRHAVVAAFLDELMSPNAYAELGATGTLAGDGELASGAYLWLDEPPTAELFDRLRAMPRVMTVSSRTAMLDQFDRMMARGFRTTSAIVVIFAAVIALGVVYNGARISLSERGRELASLRVLGFTTREVGAMLLGEQAILTVAAVPLGWALGRVFAGYLAHAFESEYYQVPIVTRSMTYAFASVVVVLASALAGVLMYRRAARLDLVAVLKTRE